MTPLNTLEQVIEYKKRIHRQTAVLELSTFFTDAEKVNVLACYNELAAICNDAIARELTVFDYQYL